MGLCLCVRTRRIVRRPVMAPHDVAAAERLSLMPVLKVDAVRKNLIPIVPLFKAFSRLAGLLTYPPVRCLPGLEASGVSSEGCVGITAAGLFRNFT